jgi:hypothetical protein
MTFTFTADASGTADAIVLPQSFPHGCKSIWVRPPAGHAWTVYKVLGATGYPLDPDQAFEFHRAGAQAPFTAGETIGYAALDTGSGTFNAIGQ